MEWSDEPRFEIAHARIRYNPPAVKGAVAMSVSSPESDEITIFGILTFKGWDHDNSLVHDCDVELDPTLEPGSIVIVPRVLLSLKSLTATPPKPPVGGDDEPVSATA